MFPNTKITLHPGQRKELLRTYMHMKGPIRCRSERELGTTMASSGGLATNDKKSFMMKNSDMMMGKDQKMMNNQSMMEKKEDTK